MRSSMEKQIDFILKQIEWMRMKEFTIVNNLLYYKTIGYSAIIGKSEKQSIQQKRGQIVEQSGSDFYRYVQGYLGKRVQHRRTKSTTDMGRRHTGSYREKIWHRQSL